MRCIVSVATGEYVKAQERLVAGVNGVRILRWSDRLPPGSPSHEDAPYGFKVYAILEAIRRGHSTILWLDAPCAAVGDLGPLFERIERDGHLFLGGEEPLGRWASDACLDAFAIDRDSAMRIGLMNGAFVGLDLRSARSREWCEGWRRACEKGLFRGSYFTAHAPPAARRNGHPTGFASVDPRCWGHRHDEAAGSCLAHRLGMRLAATTEVFGTGPLTYLGSSRKSAFPTAAGAVCRPDTLRSRYET